jgi:hypothetical protein
MLFIDLCGSNGGHLANPLVGSRCLFGRGPSLGFAVAIAVLLKFAGNDIDPAERPLVGRAVLGFEILDFEPQALEFDNFI